tara:strand:+ start:1623 stop:2186 length:564 start_codon:yes stop_codon:yes gene_type:complete
MLKKILKWPNKTLQTPSVAVTAFDDELEKTIVDLVDTCRVNYGAGLAAPQIGVNKKIVIIKTSGLTEENLSPASYNPDYMVLINPILELDGDEIEWREACLSVPDVSGKVKRKKRCSVVFMDEKGDTKKINADWPFSGVLQHEIDHLEGIVYLNKMDKRKRTALVWELSRNKRKKYIEAKRKRRNAR